MNISQDLVKQWAKKVNPLNEADSLRSQDFTGPGPEFRHGRATEKKPIYYLIVNRKQKTPTARMFQEYLECSFVERKGANDVALGDIWGTGPNSDRCFSYAFRTVKPEVALEYAKKATDKWGRSFYISLWQDTYVFGRDSKLGDFFRRAALLDTWVFNRQQWLAGKDKPNIINYRDHYDPLAKTPVSRRGEK